MSYVGSPCRAMSFLFCSFLPAVSQPDWRRTTTLNTSVAHQCSLQVSVFESRRRSTCDPSQSQVSRRSGKETYRLLHNCYTQTNSTIWIRHPLEANTMNQCGEKKIMYSPIRRDAAPLATFLISKRPNESLDSMTTTNILPRRPALLTCQFS